MPANKTITHTFILASALVLSAGCASKAPAPAIAAEGGAVAGSSSPAGILALNQQIQASRLATYATRTAKYTYFIGGVLNAEYEPQTGVLSVSSLAANESVTCKYAPDGTLFIDPKGSADAATHTNQCNGLISRLHQHINR